MSFEPAPLFRVRIPYQARRFEGIFLSKFPTITSKGLGISWIPLSSLKMMPFERLTICKLERMCTNNFRQVCFNFFDI